MKSWLITSRLCKVVKEEGEKGGGKALLVRTPTRSYAKKATVGEKKGKKFKRKEIQTSLQQCRRTGLGPTRG